jgi:hypothetical protein
MDFLTSRERGQGKVWIGSIARLLLIGRRRGGGG